MIRAGESVSFGDLLRLPRRHQPDFAHLEQIHICFGFFVGVSGIIIKIKSR